MVSCDFHLTFFFQEIIWNDPIVVLLDECSIVQSHGIPEEVIDNAVKAAKRYFSLPEASKMEVSCAKQLCIVISTHTHTHSLSLSLLLTARYT